MSNMNQPFNLDDFMDIIRMRVTPGSTIVSVVPYTIDNRGEHEVEYEVRLSKHDGGYLECRRHDVGYGDVTPYIRRRWLPILTELTSINSINRLRLSLQSIADTALEA